jgi:Xaa-Pro aminopeptidase
MVVIGEPSETYHKIYKTVLDAQKKAIRAMPGISSKQVDEAARNHISAMGYRVNASDMDLATVWAWPSTRRPG